MTAEHILEAIGLLDDSLIREAEEYRRPQPRRNYGTWLGLAASFAVVLVLGYGVTHIETGGGNSMAPAASAPAASGAFDSSGGNMFPSGEGNGAVDENDIPAHPAEPDAPAGGSEQEGPEGEFCPSIMVDGVLYVSTGEPVPAEPDPGVIQTVVSYTSGVPEMDGQTNFSQDLSARYAMTGMGLLVLVDEEWILFEPVP